MPTCLLEQIHPVSNKTSIIEQLPNIEDQTSSNIVLTVLEDFCRRLADPTGVILVAPSSEKAEGDAPVSPTRRSFKPG